MELKDITTKTDFLTKLDLIKKNQLETEITSNKSLHDLTGLKIFSNGKTGQNFCYCDFDGADIRGKVFTVANFSFARNMHKAIKDDKTAFPRSNFTGVPEAELPMTKAELKAQRCNVSKLFEDFTDKEIAALGVKENEIAEIR